MLVRGTPALVTVLLALAGCGGNDDDAPERPPSQVPAAAACPPDADALQADAKDRMSHDDFDGALAVMEKVRGCPGAEDTIAAYRVRAAERTLEIARKQLRLALRRAHSNASPQPAVSLARNSIRYHPTPAARAFLARARAELKKFQAKYGK